MCLKSQDEKTIVMGMRMSVGYFYFKKECGNLGRLLIEKYRLFEISKTTEEKQ